MKKLKFLVVDDDEVVLEVARERLEGIGFDVTTRNQSLGTSTWIIQNRPDFVLLDVMMPALTGGELATVLTRRAIHTGVILYSSKPPEELRALVERTGALGCISKSWDEKRFLEAIRILTRAPGSSRFDGMGGAR
ncbi:MAG TPA: response regulator [Polyangiaceae bacterium]|nr:response regulator [Polyangiaceae bacterium]